VSDDGKLTGPETEEERRVRAQVHRWMGMGAALLTLVAVGVAIYRLNATQAEVGMPVGEAMRVMLSGLPWVLAVIALGVVFSLGTTRLMLGIEKLVKWIRRK
jgi:FtsH-binding integral membrane protein